MHPALGAFLSQEARSSSSLEVSIAALKKLLGDAP
jgi:hypothetical protein